MAPTSETLTAERILEATEEVLRRHGPAKATVVDVARALGVSHGSVYRHFRTKAALREAVTKRWLDRTSEKLARIVDATERDPRPAAGLAHRPVRGQAAQGGRRSGTVRHVHGADRRERRGRRRAHSRTDRAADAHHHGRSRVGHLRGARPGGCGPGRLPGHRSFPRSCYAREWTRPGVGEEFTALVDLLVRGLS